MREFMDDMAMVLNQKLGWTLTVNKELGVAIFFFGCPSVPSAENNKLEIDVYLFKGFKSVKFSSHGCLLKMTTTILILVVV